MNKNATNIAILAALGFGAYYVMTRSRIGVPVAAGQPVSAQNQNAAMAGSLVGGFMNMIRGFGGSTSGNLLGTVDGRSATQWDVTPSYGTPGIAYNNPSAYVAGGLDGIAANPVSSSAWDYTGEYWY